MKEHIIREGLKRVFAPLLLDQAPNTLSAHQDTELDTIIETFLTAIDQEGLVLVRATDTETRDKKNGIPVVTNLTEVVYTDARTEKYIKMSTERLLDYDDQFIGVIRKGRVERVGGMLLKIILGIEQD